MIEYSLKYLVGPERNLHIDMHTQPYIQRHQDDGHRARITIPLPFIHAWREREERCTIVLLLY